MDNLLRRLLAMVLALALCLSVSPALAAEAAASASTVQLNKTEGTVAVTNSAGRALTQLADMRLYNGNHVATEAESCAWLMLDSTKLNKLDAVSEVELRKKDKKLEVLLNKGNLYFNVTKPLEDQETLNIRTSTMVVGIRGTSGWVKVVDQYNTLVYVLEGTVWCTVTDPLSGQSKTTALSGGETARFTIYDQARDGDKCDILLERFTEADIDGFVLEELLGDGPMCEKIYDDSGLDLRNLTEEQVRERLEQDRAETAGKLRELEALENSQERNISRDPVWTKTDDPGTEPRKPGGGNSSGGGGTAPAPEPEPEPTPVPTPEPSDVVRLTMPVTDMEVQQALNRTGVRQVVVSPGSDPARNTLEIGINMDVAAGKTLTLESGVPAQVRGGLNVDGTADIRDSLENTAGTVTVNSANTLRVGGDLVNLSEMRITASGRVIVEGTFANRGTLSPLQGARALAKVFMLTAGVPEWSVSESPDEQGYYTLVYTGAEKPELQEPKTITLELNNGEAPRTVTTGEDGRLQEPLPVPENKPGESFLGWFTEDGTTDPAKEVTEDSVFTEDTTIYAVWSREAGPFIVTGGVNAVDYDYTEDKNTESYFIPGRLSVKSSVPLTIQNIEPNTATNNSIYIEETEANIALAGVNISGGNGAALCIAEDNPNDVTIILAAGTKNILEAGGGGMAGLQKNGGADSGTLTIRGEGALIATGDTLNTTQEMGTVGGAGIGSASSLTVAASNIVIEGGVITATGGYGGAGIGGGIWDSGRNITISGGTIRAIGGSGAAGIGSGGDGGNGIGITISGSTDVTAVGGSGAADVGSGNNSSSGDFTMTGGTVNGSISVPGVNSSFTITGGEIISDGNYVVRLDCKPSLLGGTLTNTSSGGYALSYISSTASLPDEINTVIRIKGANEAFRAGETTDFIYFNPDGYIMDGPREDGYYYLAKNEDTGDFAVAGGTMGTDYSFARDNSGQGVLTVLTSAPLVVSMANGVSQTTRDTISVVSGADVTLSEVNISSSSRAPVEISEGAGDVTVILSGENSLSFKGAGNIAALQKVGGTGGLTVSGDGRLTVSGGSNAPGIGSAAAGSYPISIQGDCYIHAETQSGALQACIGTGSEYTNTSSWQGVVFRAVWPVGSDTRIKSFTVYGQVTLTEAIELPADCTLTMEPGASLKGADLLRNLPSGWQSVQGEDGNYYLQQETAP